MSVKRDITEVDDVSEQATTKKQKALEGEAVDEAHEEAAAYIRGCLPEFTPTVAIVLGSGCGGVADSIEVLAELSYADIPHFPCSTVHGHAGKLLLGKFEGVSVACLKGRVHLYEGGPPQKIRTMIYTLKTLGCGALLSTSASGSFHAEAGAGEIVCITDHVALFQGRNPLVGANTDSMGPRFPSMLNAYDPEIRAHAHTVAAEAGINLHDGIYFGCLGPSFESPAEILFMKTVCDMMTGRTGDASPEDKKLCGLVGMSNCASVVVARHCGMRVCCFGIVVNLAAGLGAKEGEHITHDDTIKYANLASSNITKILSGMVSGVSDIVTGAGAGATTTTTTTAAAQ